MAVLALVPQPKSLRMGKGFFAVPRTGYIVLKPLAITRDIFPAQRLAGHLEEATGRTWKVTRAGEGVDAQAEIHCKHDAAIRHEQGYRLTISPRGVTLAARTAQGLFYAMQTLAQVARCSGERWPALTIEDAPDFTRRGVYHDTARGKVPELSTILQLVDDLASLKINEFQLYVENNFEFRRHPEMYDDTTPFTAEELMVIDAECRKRYIDFVPSLTSLGHFEKILSRPAFRKLAEAEPEQLRKMGADCWVDAPWSLCVTDPKARQLLADMYEEFLPSFSSTLFNICCDEAYDLGKVRSRKLAEEIGTGQMYVDWIKYCNELAARQDKRIMMWGDIIRNHPELIEQLPADATLIEWGYEANHDFDGRAAVFAKAGRRFYVSPGTSSWLTLSSRTKNALGNNHAAAMAGLTHGAVGFLNTDWGDMGHQQMLSVSYVAFAYGAAVSWHAAAESNPADGKRSAKGARPLKDFLRGVSLHVFKDPKGAFATWAYELGLVYERFGWQRFNASVDWWLFREKWDFANYVNRATEAGLKRVRGLVEKLIPKFDAAMINHADEAIIRDEFLFTCQEILHTVERTALRKRWLAGEKLPAAELKRMAKSIETLREQFAILWITRNKRSRLDDVLAEFDRIGEEYRTVARSRHVPRAKA